MLDDTLRTRHKLWISSHLHKTCLYLFLSLLYCSARQWMLF